MKLDKCYCHGGDKCGDDRFEIIERAKVDLLTNTNICDSADELKVVDDFLFRCWQMGWLDKYKKYELNMKQMESYE